MGLGVREGLQITPRQPATPMVLSLHSRRFFLDAAKSSTNEVIMHQEQESAADAKYVSPYAVFQVYLDDRSVLVYGDLKYHSPTPFIRPFSSVRKVLRYSPHGSRIGLERLGGLLQDRYRFHSCMQRLLLAYHSGSR